MDTLRLTEVDADGRIRASINFDDDDRGAAFAEARARFAAGEAAATGGQAPIVALDRAFGRAYMRHDWAGLRECLADVLVLRDHRLLGFGVLPRDEWIDSLQAQRALAPDLRSESLRILTWGRHGRVEVVRNFGTVPDGGGPFENVFVRVMVTDGDRIRHYEVFDVGDADQAVARFEELCARLA